jgi:N-acetylneuraminate synthase
MQIANRKIGSEYPPFIIAEAGINHNGDIVNAKRMVNAAIKAGVDCIKFQTHIAYGEMIPSHPLYHDIQKWTLKEEEEIALKEYCDKHGIIFMSTAYCKEAVDFLDGIGVPAYKIGSGECNNLPFVEYVASKGKPVILSTGMQKWDDVQNVLCSLGDIPCLLMYCVSIYPTPYSQMELYQICGLGEMVRYDSDVYTGISDHSEGIYTALGAVALGAVAVEKHFKIYEDCPDSAVSIYPNELEMLVEGSKAIWEALQGNGDVNKENETKEWAFHSIVTLKDIKKGEMLDNTNIGIKRAGFIGIPANEWDKVVGKRVKRDLEANIALKLEDIE